MHLRRGLALVGSACVLAVPAAHAATRTSQTPAQIRAFKNSGRYDAAIKRTYAAATRYLKSQLRDRVRKPAVVLDIDETTLSNYGCLDSVDFNLSGVVDCAINRKGVAFPAARAFYRYARSRHVAVFFITGSPEGVCTIRAQNLKMQGYGGRLALTCRPASDHNSSVIPFKSHARKAIQRRGYTILANIGDQRSDLAGGAARKAFKLVNPIYIIP
jgi:predicted secreted acid phosphatase